MVKDQAAIKWITDWLKTVFTDATSDWPVLKKELMKIKEKLKDLIGWGKNPPNLKEQTSVKCQFQSFKPEKQD